jgi:hypothetical protein
MTTTRTSRRRSRTELVRLDWGSAWRVAVAVVVLSTALSLVIYAGLFALMGAAAILGG